MVIRSKVSYYRQVFFASTADKLLQLHLDLLIPDFLSPIVQMIQIENYFYKKIIFFSFLISTEWRDDARKCSQFIFIVKNPKK